MKTVEAIDKIREIAQRVAESEGLELYDVELHMGGNRCIVRIFIDKQGGVGVDDCALVSRQISLIMDVEDIIPHRYLLEVSSPGLTRALKKEENFRKVIGKLVGIKTFDLIKGKRKFIGKLMAVSKDTIRITDKEDQQDVVIPFSNISKANLEFAEKGE